MSTLNLISGPATIIQTSSVEHLNLAGTRDDSIYVHQPDGDHRLFFHGDFSRFHLYMVATHSKFVVSPETVELQNSDSFSAEVYWEAEDGTGIKKYIEFVSPMFPIRSVQAVRYGRNYDSFEIGLFNGAANQRFICDLTFLTHYARDLDVVIPLKVEYIGMSAKNGRTAHERISEGHSKLQTVLSRFNDRDLFRSASLLLYKPGELDCDSFTFEQVVETFEASLIRYFRPTPLNIEHLNFPVNRTKLVNHLSSLGIQHIKIEIESPSNASLYSTFNPSRKSEHHFIITIPS